MTVDTQYTHCVDRKQALFKQAVCVQWLSLCCRINRSGNDRPLICEFVAA